MVPILERFISEPLRPSLIFALRSPRHVLTVRHGQSYRIPQQMQAFSHSHHWEGKCGKDDSPEKSMQLNRKSRDFQSVWRKGNRICRLRRQTVCLFEPITINCSSIPPSCRSHQRFDSLSPSNSPSLSISQRGIHDIEYQLIFRSNPQFIFHDSRGFESGSLDEIETVKSFINKCARSQKLSEQLHAVWCGGYDSTPEEELTGAMTGIVSLQIPIGRYWRLTGISLMNTVTGKVSDDFPVLE